MITIQYDGKQYFIEEKISLKKILKRQDLLVLPMLEWVKLLKLVNGYCDLYMIKTVLTEIIVHHDKSSNVNSFIFKDKQLWLDKNTRLGLQQLVNSSEDKVSLVLEDEILEIPVDVANKFLKDLEVYAGKCYLNTQKHLINIKSLETLEDIINYDYTSGYPEKIVLNG